MHDTSSENKISKVPNGWVFTTLGEICEILTGKWDANHSIENGEYRFYTCAFEHLRCNTYRFDGECIILPGNGANVGELFFYNGKFDAYQRTYVLQNIKIFPKYLFYHLKLNWKKATNETQYGSATNYIRIGNFLDYEIEFPSLAQQERIVLKIEELFTKLDMGISELRQAQAQIKRYRQSVLKSAITGELTRDWRKSNQPESAEILLKQILKARREIWEDDLIEKFAEAGKILKNEDWKRKYKEPAPPSVKNLTDLPNSWTWASIEQISLKVQYGSSAKTNLDSSGIPVFRMGNIFEGKLLTDNFKYLPKDHNEFPELLLETNDLLFNRTNSAELVGKSAIYKGNPLPCSFASYLIRVKTSEYYSSDFLAFFINSTFGRNWISTVVSQQVGQANVNGTKLQALSVPLPPTLEQEKIVEEVEQLFSVADAVEKTIEESLKQAERLHQSILQKAFTGKLVPQDEGEEPASILLERIRKERETETREIKKQKSVGRKSKTIIQNQLPFAAKK